MKFKITVIGAVGDDLFAPSWPGSSSWGDLSRFHLLGQSPRAGMSLCGVLLSQSWLRGEQQWSCNGEMLQEVQKLLQLV